MILKLRFSGGSSLLAKQEKIVFTSGSRRRFEIAFIGMASIPDIMVSNLEDTMEVNCSSYEIMKSSEVESNRAVDSFLRTSGPT